MRDRARELRKTQTDTELKLWQALKQRQIQGVKFRRQYCIGYYIVDFVCLSHRIIIEVDGSQHSEKVEYDLIRTEFLSKMGYQVLRFWNNEVFQNLEAVLESINNAVTMTAPTPSLPRKRGRGLEFQCT